MSAILYTDCGINIQQALYCILSLIIVADTVLSSIKRVSALINFTCQNLTSIDVRF